LTITDIFGCSASAVIRIEVESREDVFVPTAFTPNDDGNNDSFIPSVRSVPDRMEMSIFNRWGVMVYQYDGPFGPEAGWDGSIGGKVADPAVFVYRITLHFGNKPVVLTGDITLLR
jgi:gliding motility-associated-like protein